MRLGPGVWLSVLEALAPKCQSDYLEVVLWQLVFFKILQSLLTLLIVLVPSSFVLVLDVCLTHFFEFSITAKVAIFFIEQIELNVLEFI